MSKAPAMLPHLRLRTGGAAPPRPAARLQPYTSGGGGGAPSSGAGGFAEPRTRTADEIKRAYGREPRAANAR